MTTTRIDATGFDDVIPDDRPRLFVSYGQGNTDHDEVHLSYVDEATEVILGWFAVRDLARAIYPNMKES